MDFITHLWLPILAAGAAAFVASFVCWMIIGHHKNDHLAIPNEQEFIDTIKRLKLAPGNYGFPDFQKCKNLPREEQQKKWKTGEMGQLRVWSDPSMAGNMFVTFLFFVVTNVVLAYLGWLVIPHADPALTLGKTVLVAGPSASFMHVFRVISVAAMLAFCFASFPNDIWFQKSRRVMFLNFVDGVIYALITGAIFAWLWPR